MMRAIVPMLLVLSGLPVLAVADVYVYQDEYGVTHITNINPADQRFQRLQRGCDTAPGGCYDAENPRLFLQEYRDHIDRASRDYRVHPGLIRAVIHAESAFNPAAVSKKGAQGLMQLMPGTARDLGVDDAFDPAQNIDGGVRYLSYLLDMFNDNLELAVAAYNAGENAVLRYRGIPPYQETERYVRKVRRLFRLYRTSGAG